MTGGYTLTIAEVEQIRQTWREIMLAQMDKNCDELYVLQPWQFFEAMEYLVQAICTYLDMPIPIAVSFSVMNSIEEPCECEMLLIWSMMVFDPTQAGAPVPLFDPHQMTAGKAMRLDEVQWPGRRLASIGPHPKSVMTDTIKHWEWRLRVVQDIMEGRIV